MKKDIPVEIKKDFKHFLDLKVHKNKKTGQSLVMLPKKVMKEIPPKVRIRW